MIQLRRGTSALHRQLESLPGLQRVFAQDYRMPEYIALLRALYSVFRPLEADLLDSAPMVAGDLGYRPRCTDLESDLVALAADLPVVDRGVPRASTRSAAAQVGCLYVLEGSRLGGKVIARQLASTLSLSPDRGMRFFAGSPGANGPDWLQFCRRAESLCGSPPARKAAVVAAAATFTLFYEQLSYECPVT
ncbi:MAG: biliverdin-producing heme oxygenase [Gammaproteobacteria bacterium]|nr:biliverdin-producing heme oxygenase [Gammaproteobacteria bacterium]